MLVALDATNEVIEECIAWHADLLLTHHPLLLSGIRQINDGSMHGRKVLMLAENGIAHYAMHTNYDAAKMAELAGRPSASSKSGTSGADRLCGRCTVRNRLYWRV
ncbi:MAG: Nif3-like dinuclear metal center hexameric protein [Lachnospiraceae bacterium]